MTQAWLNNHDHATGEVRGLLCHRCNKHLGIYENKELCAKFQVYLEGGE